MTKAEWDKVKASMDSPYGLITLLCDGYRLALETRLYDRKLATVVYVNGCWEGAWLLKDCEERRRFLRPIQRRRWSQRIIKGASKKMLKNMGIDPSETFTSYTLVWLSFRSLKAHLIKNNASIELASEQP